jgi:hypothetical protein
MPITAYSPGFTTPSTSEHFCLTESGFVCMPLVSCSPLSDSSSLPALKISTHSVCFSSRSAEVGSYWISVITRLGASARAIDVNRTAVTQATRDMNPPVA